MKNLSFLKKIFCIVFIVFMLSQITYCIDKSRITESKNPIFVITNKSLKDGGSKAFIGLGYKVFKWKIAADDSFKTRFEIYKFFAPKSFEDGPSIDIDTI